MKATPTATGPDALDVPRAAAVPVGFGAGARVAVAALEPQPRTRDAARTITSHNRVMDAILRALTTTLVTPGVRRMRLGLDRIRGADRHYD